MEKQQSNGLIILEALIIFDLWLLVKARRCINEFVQLSVPIFKTVFIMALGAAFFLVYALTQARFDVSNRNQNFRQNDKQITSKYLEIGDSSNSDIVNLKKELLKYKSKTIFLEKSLYKLKIHSKNFLYDYQKNMGINLADFASEAIGGLVIDTPDTQSFYKSDSSQLTLFGIPILKPNYHTPRKVIQPWSQPGECWAFSGSQGKIEIELAHAVMIDKVSLEHIPASASLTGKIDSAPKMFNILGKVGKQYVMIDTFVYKNKGSSSQTFKITKPELKEIPFKRVIFEILSNWGNPEYTCIYRFKVHGKMYDLSNEEANMKVQ